MLEIYCRENGITLSALQKETLKKYAHFLLKWNQVINLTAIQTIEAVESHHLCDSLSVLPYVQGCVSLADVGTGGGLPGIPLAIMSPTMSVTLIESQQKKCYFLQYVVGQLGLSNVKVVHARVERYQPEAFFEKVITRAYSNFSQMLQQTAHLCDNEGRFLAMKGLVAPEELSEVSNRFILEQKIELQVPGFSHRSLWIFKKGDV